MKYYEYKFDDFQKLRPDWEFLRFESLQHQNEYFANDLILRIDKNNNESKKTVIVLPVGPIDYTSFITRVNQEKINLENLIIFFMDEYANPDGSYIPTSHPLSFRSFVDRSFYKLISENSRMPYQQIIFPNGSNPQETIDLINHHGGIEITYGGFGMTGHLAFNDPPDDIELQTEENVRYSTVRLVELTRETLIQNAMGGTGGNIEIIPRFAVTLGMKEMLAAKEIHLYLLRTWHAGIARRALFGPVSPSCPGSYVQKHTKVKVCMTPEALKLPMINVTLNIGT